MAKADLQGSKSCGIWWCVSVSGHDVLQEPWSSYQELLTQQNTDTHQITCILSNIVVRTSNLPLTILPEVSSVNSYFLFTNSHTSIKLTSLVLQDSQNYDYDNKNLWVLACFKFRSLLSSVIVDFVPLAVAVHHWISVPNISRECQFRVYKQQLFIDHEPLKERTTCSFRRLGTT
jgi:hypothetical protein